MVTESIVHCRFQQNQTQLIPSQAEYFHVLLYNIYKKCLFVFLQDLNADVETCTVAFIDILINMTAALTTRQMAGPRFQRTIL